MTSHNFCLLVSRIAYWLTLKRRNLYLIVSRSNVLLVFSVIALINMNEVSGQTERRRKAVTHKRTALKPVTVVVIVYFKFLKKMFLYGRNVKSYHCYCFNLIVRSIGAGRGWVGSWICGRYRRNFGAFIVLLLAYFLSYCR